MVRESCVNESYVTYQCSSQLLALPSAAAFAHLHGTAALGKPRPQQFADVFIATSDHSGHGKLVAPCSFAPAVLSQLPSRTGAVLAAHVASPSFASPKRWPFRR